MRQLLDGIATPDIRQSDLDRKTEQEAMQVINNQTNSTKESDREINLEANEPNILVAVGFTALMLGSLAIIVAIFTLLTKAIDGGRFILILIASLLVIGLLTTAVLVVMGKVSGKDFTTVTKDFFRGIGLVKPALSSAKKTKTNNEHYICK